MVEVEKTIIGVVAIITAAAVVVYFGNRIGRAASEGASKLAEKTGDAASAAVDAVSLTSKNILYRGVNQVGDLIDDGLDNESFDLGEKYRDMIGANP